MKNENNWEPGSWWFWLAFIGLILVTMLGAVTPVAMLALIPVYIAIGISVIRQNQTPGPHRMLGFTLTLLGGILLVAGVIVVFMMPSSFRVYSSTSGPFVYPPPGGYTIIQPTAWPHRIAPENTAEVVVDPILLGVTKTIAAATAQSEKMLSATPVLTPTPQ